MPDRNLLSSWKEIAAYLGKGVRTVQRWERELGLPVRRPSHDKHVVLTTCENLDAWMADEFKRQGYRGRRGSAGDEALHREIAELQQKLTSALQRISELEAQLAQETGRRGSGRPSDKLQNRSQSSSKRELS